MSRHCIRACSQRHHTALPALSPSTGHHLARTHSLVLNGPVEWTEAANAVTVGSMCRNSSMHARIMITCFTSPMLISDLIDAIQHRPGRYQRVPIRYLQAPRGGTAHGNHDSRLQEEGVWRPVAAVEDRCAFFSALLLPRWVLAEMKHEPETAQYYISVPGISYCECSTIAILTRQWHWTPFRSW